MDWRAESRVLRDVLAANVRRLRKARGWSQEVLGDAADLHRTQVGAIERAEKNVQLGTIAKLSVALDVGALDLLRAN